jgi:hypothetical protein
LERAHPSVVARPAPVEGHTPAKAPTSSRTAPHFIATNPGALVALQRAAGNSAVEHAVTVQRDRDELLKAYGDEVDQEKWDAAAVRLNGFSDKDIKERLKLLGYDKRTKLLAACPDWNHRVRTPALNMNFDEDVREGRMASAASTLNGFNDDDIAGHFANLATDKHLALLIACPDWAKRVLDIGMRLQPTQKKREWPVPDFIAIWEKLHGTTMSPAQKEVLRKGCIGITRLNLDDGAPNPPLGLSFDSFEHALQVAAALNQVLPGAHTAQQYAEMAAAHPLLSQLTGIAAALPSTDPTVWKAVVFSKRFYANQNPDWKKRQKKDTKSFKPDAKGQVDMNGYNYEPRPDPSVGPGENMINFDYGWYDEATNTWFHANHGYDGMKVYQSTLSNFSRPLQNFDRQIFVVAMARK